MLRTRASAGRGNLFVCALCRHKLAKTEQLRFRGISTLPRPAKPSRCVQQGNISAPSIVAVRSLSTTAVLSNDDRSPSLGSMLNDGLLPHERAARQRMAASRSAPSQPPRTAEPRQQQRPRPNQVGGHNRRGGRVNDAQASASSSVLSDVFNARRQPRTPPTPQSWSHRDQQQGRPATATWQSSPSPNTSRDDARSTGDSYGSDRPARGRKSPGWDAFDRIEPGAPSQPSNQASGRGGNERPNGDALNNWSSTTNGRKTPSHSWKQNSQERRSDGAPTSGARPAASEKGFWDELENRVSGLNSRKPPMPPRSADASLASRERDASQMGRWQVQNDTAPSRSRRSSRFERQQQEAEGRTKKSAQRQQNRGGCGMDLEDDWDEESSYRWELKKRRKAEERARGQREPGEEQEALPIFLPEYINVGNLGKAIKQPMKSFLRDLEQMGFENLSEDTIMTGETAALVVMEYGYEPTVDSGSLRDLKPRPAPEDVSTLPSRPPVVTIMGHVDHGKTTLLDWLRKSSVAAQEHGGITQHIGAFVVKMSSGSPITFLDTPGHAAFLSMRQRGANVTDIVVLVVAADDSVMPQTLEALKHATSAKVPIIVAINKIDKEDARVDQVKADLSRHGVQIEDYGGDVQVVGVSGKTGQGMQDLEENIVTLSELLDVRSEVDGPSEGWILESSVKLDGKVATVLVKRGTLRQGDLIVAGKTWARIRVLRNEAGVELSEAPPGTPVEILGWRDLPTAGEQVLQAPDEAKAKTAVEYRLEMADREESSAQLAEQEQRQREKKAAEEAAERAKRMGAEADDVPAEPGITYQNVTVKADVAGSVEAVCASILELGNHEVRPRILRSGAGPLSEYDVDHAATAGGVIVNFNSAVPPHIKQRAEDARVRILDHSVIYHLIDSVKEALERLLPDLAVPRVLGEADILQTFDINIRKKVFRRIAGCRVRNGTIKKTSMVKVLRRGKVVFDGKIDTLKHVKKDVEEMGKGTECGIGLEDFEDFRVDDQIQTYEVNYEKRHL